MKAKDVEVGGEYAYNYYNDRAKTRVDRCRVEAVNQPRQAWDGFHSVTKNDGILVTLLDGDNKRGRRLITARVLVGTWAMWEPTHQERLRIKQRSWERKAEAAIRQAKAIELADLVLGEGEHDVAPMVGGGDKVVMSARTFVQVAQLVAIANQPPDSYRERREAGHDV